jgi:predicted Zn-dependent peptidase
MAHLLEHMMFKGSPQHRNVMKLVEERGGHINGTTWLDRRGAAARDEQRGPRQRSHGV